MQSVNNTFEKKCMMIFSSKLLGKLYVKFLSGTLRVIEKVSLLSFFDLLLKQLLKFILIFPD